MAGNQSQSLNEGYVEAGMQILTKDERDITVLCSSNEDNLRNELQIWEADGYRKVHPSPFYVRIFRRNLYKIGIYRNGVQVSSEDGYKIRQDCLERGDHHAFCIDQEYIGKDLQFKLQDVTSQEILKTYPIKKSASADTSAGAHIYTKIGTMSAQQATFGSGPGFVTMADNARVKIQSQPSQGHADP